MTNTNKTLKNGKIKFVLDVTTSVDKPGYDNNPIDFKLNLNPDSELIRIGDALSTREDLILVFKRIIKILEKIDKRTAEYASLDSPIDRNAAEKLGFIEIYQDNFTPPFEKIDRIVYSHHSPGEAGVSYARSYNGDKRPDL